MIDLEAIQRRRERVRDMTRAGFSAANIAAVLNVSERTVQRDRVAAGCAMPFAGIPKSADQIDYARQLLADGCSVHEAARTVGCSPQILYRRFPGASWTRQQCAEHVGIVQRFLKRGVAV